MNTTKQRAIVGVFTNESEAQAAVSELRIAGFRDDQIGVARRHTQAEGTLDETSENYAGEGAAAGVAAGAGLGALWGLGILAGVMPVIGPAIAGGTLAIVLSSAAAGAAAAGLTGALVGLGMSKEDAEFYDSEFRAGRTVVTVSAEGRESEASAILNHNHAYDRNNELVATPMM